MFFSESDFKNLQISKCDSSVISDFLKLINNETLGMKVLNAINQSKQDHFNKAILNISGANRDQVSAIREIQSILDELKGGIKTKIIFDKYRQKFPFQIGIANGEEILSLLDKIKSLFCNELAKIIGELHQNEEKLSTLNEELNFFKERVIGKISKQELDELRKNILLLVICIVSTKKLIIENLNNFLRKEFRSASPNLLMRLIRNFFVIITSSIETLDTELVEV